jgi:hypothetical protein
MRALVPPVSLVFSLALLAALLRPSSLGAASRAKQAPAVAPGVQVVEYDLLASMGLDRNGVGPVLVRADPEHSRILVAHTLGSTLSLVDDQTDAVRNVAVGARALQHLKAEALALRPSTGRAYLVADHALIVEDDLKGEARTYMTADPFEAVAVDDATGNAFLVGRASGRIGFYVDKKKKILPLDGLSSTKPLSNLNQTPPPSIRKVVALPSSQPGQPGRFAVVDGVEARLHLYDAGSGKRLASRELPITAGGRWHLAGADPARKALFLVTETDDRRVLQAARLGLGGPGEDRVVALPGYTEGVAMIYDPVREKVYVNYDNHACLHVVDFSHEGALSEIDLPSFGNDAAALDAKRGLLYVASWARGEVEVVDVESGRFVRRFENLGILPHMHAMTLDPETDALYFPQGATAVNGAFGASITRLDTETGATRRIRTGFAPIDLIDVPERGSVLVFSNEDQFAEIRPASPILLHNLPHPWPIQALRGPQDRIYLHYGPHQSYWPVVYIWGARDGVLSFDPHDLSFHDRRVPRQSLGMLLYPQGTLWMAQNNWGREKAFLTRLDGPVREHDIGRRIELSDEVERETTQRLLAWEPGRGRLVLGRVGEKDTDPGVLHVVDPEMGVSERRVEIGQCPADLLVEGGRAFVANFLSNDVSVVDLATGELGSHPAGRQPLFLTAIGGRVFVVDHGEPRVREIGGRGAVFSLPTTGRADGVTTWKGRLIVSVHGADRFEVLALDPTNGAVERLVERRHPYGPTGFDTGNAAFYLCGQFGDAVRTLSPSLVDGEDRLWVADFLGGRVYALEGAASAR